MTKQSISRSPWSFLPTLYFAEGLAYVLINTVSVILYKRMALTRILLFLLISASSLLDRENAKRMHHRRLASGQLAAEYNERRYFI